MYDKNIVNFDIKDSPFFNFLSSRYSITFNVNAKETYEYCKNEDLSFFNCSLAILLEGLNQIPEFKWRIIDDKVFEFEKIDAITPILQSDNTIKELRVKPLSEFKSFNKWYDTLDIMKNNISDYEFTIDTLKRDFEPIANFSCIPWINFTSLTSAVAFSNQIQPLISWGKYSDGLMPVSCSISHIFIYGYHIKLFNDEISNYFSNPHELF